MSNWSISLTTFNCGKDFPHGEDEQIESIIRRITPKDEALDIYVVGFQEFVSIWEGSFPDLVAIKLVGFAQLMRKILNEKFTNRYYSLSGYHSLGATGLLIISDDSLNKGTLSYSSCRRGMVGSSLKGGATISFQCQKQGSEPETFTFLCCHLAANGGEKYKLLRNNDYNGIISALDVELRLTNFKYGHIFVLGDLNFRLQNLINSNIDFNNIETIRTLMKNNEELTLLRNEGKIFEGFQEATIDFPPTYKYHLQTYNDYSLKRIPSWCDRILYKDYDEDVTKIIKYTSIERFPELQFTDHQPVNLTIEIPLSAPMVNMATIKTIPTPQLPIIGDTSDLVIGYTGYFMTLRWYYKMLLPIFLYILYYLYR